MHILDIIVRYCKYLYVRIFAGHEIGISSLDPIWRLERAQQTTTFLLRIGR